MKTKRRITPTTEELNQSVCELPLMWAVSELFFKQVVPVTSDEAIIALNDARNRIEKELGLKHQNV